MANQTTIECLKYLQAKGHTAEERQHFFSRAPYVLKAQIISAQRGLKQQDVNFLVPTKFATREECLNNEREQLKKEIDLILETCINSIYNDQVKSLIVSILKTLPVHDDAIEQVNEKAGELYKKLTLENKIEESKRLAVELKLEGDEEAMRRAMDVFLNTYIANKLDELKSQAQFIYDELLKAKNP
jgi:hypothetical protein